MLLSQCCCSWFLHWISCLLQKAMASSALLFGASLHQQFISSLIYSNLTPSPTPDFTVSKHSGSFPLYTHSSLIKCYSINFGYLLTLKAHTKYCKCIQFRLDILTLYLYPFEKSAPSQFIISGNECRISYMHLP